MLTFRIDEIILAYPQREVFMKIFRLKKIHLLLFVIIGMGVTACVPNRLTGSLSTREPGAAPVVEARVPDGRNLQPQLGDADIDLDNVVALLPPDGIPAILPDEVESIMVTAAEADAAGMDPSVRVMGVSINGESVAYPIPFMSQHEIVNDTVGGQLIAATW